MLYSILLHPKAAEYLDKYREPYKSRIKDKLKELKEEPEEKGKRLRYTKFWRVKIGDHRAIYQIKPVEQQVIVLFIGHRRGVYDDFSKLVWDV